MLYRGSQHFSQYDDSLTLHSAPVHPLHASQRSSYVFSLDQYRLGPSAEGLADYIFWPNHPKIYLRAKEKSDRTLSWNSDRILESRGCRSPRDTPSRGEAARCKRTHPGEAGGPPLE